VLDQNADAVAWATGLFAVDTSSINGNALARRQRVEAARAAAARIEAARVEAARAVAAGFPAARTAVDGATAGTALPVR
jgi:hypothetical protein